MKRFQQDVSAGFRFKLSCRALQQQNRLPMKNQMRIFGECTYKGNRFNGRIDCFPHQLQILKKRESIEGQQEILDILRSNSKTKIKRVLSFHNLTSRSTVLFRNVISIRFKQDVSGGFCFKLSCRTLQQQNR